MAGYFLSPTPYGWVICGVRGEIRSILVPTNVTENKPLYPQFWTEIWCTVNSLSIQNHIRKMNSLREKVFCVIFGRARLHTINCLQFWPFLVKKYISFLGVLRCSLGSQMTSQSYSKSWKKICFQSQNLTKYKSNFSDCWKKLVY
jgi:hypothetical protein